VSASVMSTSTVTCSESETEAAGAALARRLGPGACVLLVGDLGAGKTAFVRGMAAALDIPPDEVSSPTFTLIQEYRGTQRLYHVDLYRVSGAEIDDLGLDELSASGGIVAIEWGEKLAGAVPKAVRVTIVDRGNESRQITIDGPDLAYSDR
jgi:tRNA threonylcarbamoyladenosine biosynthesis protein TsaE